MRIALSHSFCLCHESQAPPPFLVAAHSIVPYPCGLPILARGIEGQLWVPGPFPGRASREWVDAASGGIGSQS